MSARSCCAGAAVLAAGLYRVGMSSTSQVLGPFPWRGSIDSDRRIALSFDDGPNAPYTERIASVLERAGVRGTFFQVGANVARAPEVTRALVESGHVIGNHSFSHRFELGFAPGDIAAEIDRAQEVLTEVVGRAPALYRPPWLVRTPALFRALEQRGLTAVSGLFAHPLEVAQIDARRIASRAEHRARRGAILIFHDGYNASGAARDATADAVARLVDRLQLRGHRLVTVDQLLGQQAYR